MLELYDWYVQNHDTLRAFAYLIIVGVYTYWCADSYSKKDYLGTAARAFTAMFLLTGLIRVWSGNTAMTMILVSPMAIIWALFSLWAVTKRIRENK